MTFNDLEQPLWPVKHLFIIDAYFENLYEDRPILSAEKMQLRPLYAPA